MTYIVQLLRGIFLLLNFPNLVRFEASMRDFIPKLVLRITIIKSMSTRASGSRVTRHLTDFNEPLPV